MPEASPGRPDRIRASHQQDASGTRVTPLTTAIGTVCLGAMSLALTMPAQAQAVRDVIAGAHLGSGYSALLNLAVTPDISTASYRIRGEASPFEIDILRLPYEARLAELQAGTSLYGRIVGGYLTADLEVPLSSGTGAVASSWTAYSLTGGLVAKIDLGGGMTFSPAMDFSLARLTNDAAYSGSAASLQPVLDGLLFNWQADTYGLTPSVAFSWTQTQAGRRLAVRTHAAWSRIRTFRTSDEAQSFDESAGVYSVRAEFGAPSGLMALDRALDWFAVAGFGGFYGANRHALGFTEVAELGGGVEIPLQAGPERAMRLRLSASLLRGGNVTGWTVGLGLGF